VPVGGVHLPSLVIALINTGNLMVRRALHGAGDTTLFLSAK